MRVFFQGWQRKVGCVTLLMACVSLGLWTRSRFYNDMFLFSLTPLTQLEINFAGRAIECDYRWQTERDDLSTGIENFVDWMTFRNDDPDAYQILLPRVSDNQWQMSLSSGRTISGKGKTIEWPYGTSVLGLTLISAGLILWRPRKSNRGPSSLSPPPQVAHHGSEQE